MHKLPRLAATAEELASLALARAASASAAATSVLVYRQGGVSHGNVFATWAEIKAAITPGCTIVVDSSLAPGGLAHVPAATGVTSLTGVMLTSYRNGNRPPDALNTLCADQLQVDDGAQLFGVKQIVGFLGLVLDSKTVPGLAFNYTTTNNDFLFLYNPSIVMSPTATIPGIEVPSGGELDIVAYDTTFGAPGGTVAVANAAGTASLEMVAYDGCTTDHSAFSGSVSSTFLYGHDSNDPYIFFPGVLSTQTDFRIDAARWSDPATTTTSSLPVPPYVLTGQLEFCTDKVPTQGGTPVYWNGARWVGPSMFGAAIGQSPTLTPQTSLGSTGTSTLTSNSDDTAGSVTLTPGGSGIASGTLATFGFTAALPTNSPRSVQLTPTSVAAAALQAAVVGQGTAGWSIAVGVAPTDSVPYTWNYLVVP